MTQPVTPAIICAACGATGTGRFCSSCGASLVSSRCEGCGAELTPGARYCHSCGRSSGSAAQPPSAAAPLQPRSPASTVPWVIAAVAVVSLLAFLAGNAFNSRKGSSLDAPQNALPQAGLDDRRPSAAPSAEGGRAPDISQLSPQERADRLFNRIMALASQGKSDSVLFFAPMAISSYLMLAPMNADQRYDLGRVAEVSGALPLARAQADTILQQNPGHLLGLILASRVASLDKRAADQKALDARLLAGFQAEMAKRLPEYERHEDDINNAMTEVRRAAPPAK